MPRGLQSNLQTPPEGRSGAALAPVDGGTIKATSRTHAHLPHSLFYQSPENRQIPY